MLESISELLNLLSNVIDITTSLLILRSMMDKKEDANEQENPKKQI